MKHLNIIAALVVGISSLAAPTSKATDAVSSSELHVRVAETARLSSGGLDLPRVYFLSASGGLLFSSDVRQPSEEVLSRYKELNSARPGSMGDKKAPIVAIAQERGFRPTAGNGITILLVSPSTSLGPCSACSSYYPQLREEFADAGVNANWVTLLLEPNDYKYR